MSNPFASTAFSPTVPAPNAAPPPVAPAPSGAGGLDDPSLYQGGGAPLLPNNLDGRWKLQILSVSGGKGYESGFAVHITFKILETTQPATPVGSTYRVFYKFDYQRLAPVDGKQGTVHAGLLGKFVAALFRKEYSDPTFSKTAALASICTNATVNGAPGPGLDFSRPDVADFAKVELVGELRNRKQTDGQTGAESTAKLRSDIWQSVSA